MSTHKKFALTRQGCSRQANQMAVSVAFDIAFALQNVLDDRNHVGQVHALRQHDHGTSESFPSLH